MSAAGRDDLLERDGEIAELAEMAALARAGDGRVALVEGAAGIGKTRVLANARRLADSAGMRVIGARAGELERAYSFGVVRQIFEPVLAAASAAERDALLAGAAGLATRVLETAGPGAATVDPFPAYHGLYWLTANLAATAPVLIAVDDLHWCDAPSLGFLDFLARRLDGVAVLLVAAARPNEPGAEQALIDALARSAAASVITLRPLSEAAAAELVRVRLGADIAPAFAGACHAATGGNPLLLAELAKAVAAERIDPTAANAERVLEIGPQAVARAVRLRLTTLDPDAMALADAASVLGDGALIGDASSLAGITAEAGLAAAGTLATVDLLRPSEVIEFVHPVLRAAVYAGLGLAGQRLAHTRAARLLASLGRPPEQIAVHVLASPPTGSEAAVAALRAAARRALADGAARDAVAYLDRALREPPADADLADILLELAEAEGLVNGPNAVAHLERALVLSQDPSRRAAITLGLGRGLYFAHRIPEAADAFVRGLAEPDLPAPASRSLETAFAVLGLFDPALVGTVRERAQSFDRDAPPASLDDLILLAYLGYDDARTMAATLELCVERAFRAYAGGRVVTEDSQGAWAAVQGTLVAAEAFGEAERVGRAVLEAGQAAGSVFLSTSGMIMLGLAKGRGGALADGAAEAAGAIETAREHGFATVANWGSGHLADMLTDRGAAEEALELLAGNGMMGALPDNVHLYEAQRARGRALIASGKVREGVDDLLVVGARFEAIGGRNPASFSWRCEAAEGLLSLGDVRAAQALAEADSAAADAWGTPGARARALGTLGLVVGGAEGLTLLERAVELASQSQARLQRARWHGDLGAALRRANRRSDAREQLQLALDLAHRCGAVPLRERVMVELLATGARPRRIAARGRDALTPSELRIAEMAAEGLSNREIAQRLFVTQKTVETHLARVFRKLDVESRAQLPLRLGDR